MEAGKINDCRLSIFDFRKWVLWFPKKAFPAFECLCENPLRDFVVKEKAAGRDADMSGPSKTVKGNGSAVF